MEASKNFTAPLPLVCVQSGKIGISEVFRGQAYYEAILIVMHTDLVFELQNDCIIHKNLLGCATRKHCENVSQCLLESPF